MYPALGANLRRTAHGTINLVCGDETLGRVHAARSPALLVSGAAATVAGRTRNSRRGVDTGSQRTSRHSAYAHRRYRRRRMPRSAG